MRFFLASPASNAPSDSGTRLPRWRRLAGPYPAAAVLVLALAAGVDALLGPGPRSTSFLLSLVGLVLALGTLCGLLWQALLGLLGRLPPWIGRAFWPLLTAAAATVLAERLNAFTRLDSRYRALALGVLAACAAGAALMGALLALMQPNGRAPRGWLGELERRWRLAAGLLLLSAAVAVGYADRALYVGLYADAHLALRACGFTLAVHALVLCRDLLRLPDFGPAWAVAAALWASVPLGLLNDDNRGALQGFGMRAWSSTLLGAARALVDLDFDGYASLLGGGDCAPLDPRVHPLAREVPDNGIDDNCMFGDARLRTRGAERLPAPEGPSPLDVVLITVDTLRQDHVGAYNPAYSRRGRPVTPNLDRWAKRATVFQQAYTNGGWTSIVFPSLLRGVYPRRLRWTRYYETNFNAMIRKPFAGKLRRGERPARIFPFAYDDPYPSLAQRLKRRGMYTAAVIDDGYSQILRPGTGLETGFDIFLQTDHLRPDRRNDRGTVNNALKVLRRMGKDQRFFMWVHLFGPHGPDETHHNTPVFGNTPRDRYDHEVVYLDRQLHRLLSALSWRQEPVAVFVTADHGELLFINTRNHGFTLQEGEIRIPLLARVPGWPAGPVPGPASLVDIVPTILALTRTPAPPDLDGIDLETLLKAPKGKVRPRIILADTWQFEADGRKTIDNVAALDGSQKVVLDRMKNIVFAYDQQREHDRNRRIDRLVNDALTRAVHAYIDETGGELSLRD